MKVKKVKNHGKASKPKALPPQSDSGLPTYDSLAQAVAATGIPLAILQKAKREGCPAFKSNRVYLAEFLKWHFATDGEYVDINIERALLMREDRIAKERENKREADETVTLTEVDRLIAELVTLPLRERIMSQSSRLDVRANPANPEIARLTITQDNDETLKLLRDKLPQPKKEK